MTDSVLSRIFKLLLLLAPACACGAPKGGQQQNSAGSEEIYDGDVSIVGLDSPDPAVRAAQVTMDPRARAELLHDVRTPAARSRIGWADAQARERGGDLLGAARVCD